MSARVSIKVLGALMLISAANPALSQSLAELPGGDSAAFRERMMTWAPAEVDGPVDRAPVAPATRSKLRITSPFGLRQDPFDGRFRAHSGIDIAAQHGAAIYSASAGKVVFAGRSGGYGNMIELDHGNGLRTRYAHLSRILARPGSAVATGEIIGEAGSTGRSTGSHLHFEVRKHGEAQNPLTYFEIPQRVVLTGAGLPSLEPHQSNFARSRAALASGGGPM